MHGPRAMTRESQRTIIWSIKRRLHLPKYYHIASLRLLASSTEQMQNKLHPMAVLRQDKLCTASWSVDILLQQQAGCSYEEMTIGERHAKAGKTKEQRKQHSGRLCVT